jgi:hypothetical protein
VRRHIDVSEEHSASVARIEEKVKREGSTNMRSVLSKRRAVSELCGIETLKAVPISPTVRFATFQLRALELSIWRHVSLPSVPGPAKQTVQTPWSPRCTQFRYLCTPPVSVCNNSNMAPHAIQDVHKPDSDRQLWLCRLSASLCAQLQPMNPADMPSHICSPTSP